MQYCHELQFGTRQKLIPKKDISISASYIFDHFNFAIDLLKRLDGVDGELVVGLNKEKDM